MISFLPTAVYLDRTWKIITVVMINAAMWMKSVAESALVNPFFKSIEGYNTSLKYKSICEFNIACVANWLDAIWSTEKSAKRKWCLLTNEIE